MRSILKAQHMLSFFIYKKLPRQALVISQNTENIELYFFALVRYTNLIAPLILIKTYKIWLFGAFKIKIYRNSALIYSIIEIIQ